MFKRAQTRHFIAAVSVNIGLVTLCVIGMSCRGQEQQKIGDATLAPLVAGTNDIPDEAKDAPTVVVMPDSKPTIPQEPIVKLAIDRDVMWGMVKAIIDRMYEYGQTPVLLVDTRGSVKEFHLNDNLIDKPLEIFAELEGKLCVQHPAANEAICTQTQSRRFIDGSHTREIVRKAVLGYERSDVVVALPMTLKWRDVVTAVGATRSCCGKTPVRVRIHER